MMIPGGKKIKPRLVMESRDLVSVSGCVSRPVFWSLSLGLEGIRFCLGLEGFRSRALLLETLHSFFEVLQEGVP